MKPSQILLSTIGSDAEPTAREYGLGMEIAQFCTASNMDSGFPAMDAAVRKQIEGIENRTFHAPFNELFPCAIDPMARELARSRYRQAIKLAKSYGASKVIIHGGYHPRIYYPIWYTEQSILFWKDFLKEDPGVQIVLENVLEEEPGMLLDIVRGVNHPRLRLCLDVGHVNAYSPVPVVEWLDAWGTWTQHFHIHNNDGSWDTHSGLDQGSIPMAELLERAQILCPGASYTLELIEARPSVRWMIETHMLSTGGMQCEKRKQ